MSVRLFVAVPIRERLRAELATWCSRQQLDGARWTPPVNLHVTVHFLGNVQEADVARLGAALGPVVAACEPFALEVAEARPAPSRRPHMVWATLAGDERFDQLAMAVAEVSGPFAARSRPPRPGRPHITLARLRGAVAGAIEPLELSDPFVPVEEVGLVESRLSPKGARYETLRTFPLGA